MTSLSTRPIENIGLDDPVGIKPDEQQYSSFNHEDDSDVDSDNDDENYAERDDDEYNTETETEAETTSEVSEVESFQPLPKILKKPKANKVYTVILQEEEFIPE